MWRQRVLGGGLFDMQVLGKRDRGRYWKDAPRGAVRSFLVPAYWANTTMGVRRSSGTKLCARPAFAVKPLCLAAKAMGYVLLPYGWFFVILKRSRNSSGYLTSMSSAFMVAIGKKTQDAWPRPGQLAYEEVVIQDRFP